MSSPSNLYAEKIYAEQPIALWSLDDDATFVPALSLAESDLFTWTRSGAQSGESGAVLAELSDNSDPFPQILSPASFISVQSTAEGILHLTSTTTFSSESAFSAGLWVNPQVVGRINLITLSYSTGSSDTPIAKKEWDLSTVGDRWTYLSNIFEVSSPVVSKNFRVSIDFGEETGLVYLNGLSVGFNQEFFGSYSSGVSLSTITDSSITGYGYPAYQYGLGDNNGWYLGDNTNKKLYSKSRSMPLVYGSRESITLYENENAPSLIVPGFGFLHESGEKNNLAFEAWVRIKTDGTRQTNPFRIIGPIASSDGIYVNGQHLILKVGSSVASHYVGEWYRPMLLDIEYSKDSVKMFVNGESVCNIDISDQVLVLPDAAEDNFIGFYVGDNVKFMDVDCIAIYPYRLSSPMLKRRFGYGQAVQVPSEIETGYSGKQLSIDYTFAGYSSDYSYPMIESWKSSVKDNIYSNSNIMGSPTHSLPEIINNSDLKISEWISDNAVIGSGITMIPESKWDSANVHLFLERIQQPGMSSVHSIFLAGKANASYEDRDQVLLRIVNRETLDNLSIVLSGTSLIYVYNVYGVQGEIVTKTMASTSSDFVVGISKTSLSSLPAPVVRFLNGWNRYSLYIGGDYYGNDSNISTTFGGKIYKFGILTKNNHNKENADALFTDSVAKHTNKSSFVALRPSYSVHGLVELFGEDSLYSLENESMSYWQDYLPLKKFAKEVTLTNGSSSYLTDMIQISIDAAASEVISELGKVDSSSVDIKSYVYFVESDQIKNISSFGTSSVLALVDQPLGFEKVVDASVWANKRFEVVDGTVIYPPQTNQENISMVTIVEVYTKSTSKYPTKIRSLAYAAQTLPRATTTTFDHNVAKKIGTRSSSSSVYLFSEDNGVFDYSAYNPVSISKASTPYLYLTNKTGLKVLDSYSTGEDRGIYIPLNEGGREKTKISLVSMVMMFNDAEFPAEMTICEFYPNTSTVYPGKVRLVAKALTSDTSRATLLMQKFNGTAWSDLSNVVIYVNGTLMSQPVLSAGEWSSIGLYFESDSLDVSGSSDRKIEIVGSILVNNVSYYQLRPEEIDQQILTNEWNDISSGVWTDISTMTWTEVYATEAFVKPSLTPNTIFDIYTGTNKILSVVYESPESGDDSGIGIYSRSYSIVESVNWQQPITISP